MNTGTAWIIVWLAAALGFLVGFGFGAVIGRGALRRDLQDAVARRMLRERKAKAKGRRGSARLPRLTTPAELVELSARNAAADLKAGDVVFTSPKGLAAWLARQGARSRVGSLRGWGR